MESSLRLTALVFLTVGLLVGVIMLFRIPADRSILIALGGLGLALVVEIVAVYLATRTKGLQRR